MRTATATLNPSYDMRPLQEARLVQGLTLTELAHKAGLAICTASVTLSGKHQNPRSISRLAQALAIPMERLVCRDTQPQDDQTPDNTTPGGESENARPEGRDTARAIA